MDQKKIYEELTVVRSKQKINNNDLSTDNMNGLVMIHGRKMSSSSMSNGLNAGGWFEYGAIDDGIIEKLRDEEDVHVRLTGADELNRDKLSLRHCIVHRDRKFRALENPPVPDWGARWRRLHNISGGISGF